ncbi:MAG: site-specific integrase [Candidatus Bathyarchaeota archaeon]|nr:site-specific integrase [Candidatus Termiticorpusculum sp.]
MSTQIKIRGYNPGSYREKFLKHFGQPIEHYTAFQRAVIGLQFSTTYSYADMLSNFFLYLNKDPDTVIKERQKDLRNKDLVARQRYESEIKLFLNKQKEHGLLARSYFTRISGFFTNNSTFLRLDMGNYKTSKSRKSQKYSPTREEVQTLIKNAKTTRNRLIITIAYQNGLLPADIANLKIGDYPTEPYIAFRKLRQKSNTPYYGVSTPDTCKLLKQYLTKRKGKDGEPLFVGETGLTLRAVAIREAMSKTMKRAKLYTARKFVPKCLRDGYADALIDINANFYTLNSLLGHSNAMIFRYGSEKKVCERAVKVTKKVYPLIKLDLDDLTLQEERFKKTVCTLKCVQCGKEETYIKTTCNRKYCTCCINKSLKRIAQQKKYYLKNKETIDKKRIAYRHKHKDEINKRRRIARLNKKLSISQYCL